MSDGSLDEVKKAAKAYVTRQDVARTRIGVVQFDSDARTISPLTNDKNVLSTALDSLQPDGLTRMDLGLHKAQDLLRTRSALRLNSSPFAETANVLLFTDGSPTGMGMFGLGVDAVKETDDAAAQLRTEGVKLVAIGSAGADTDYLATLTGSPKLVFKTSQGSFDEAFTRAEAVLKETGTAQLISSGVQKNVDDGRALWRLSGWNAILGGMLAIALVLAQAHVTRARLRRTDALAVVTGLIVGAVAGAVGQGAFALLASEGNTALAVGRLLGWSLLGAGAGVALAWSLPNVRRSPILIGGAVGGVVGAVAFAVGVRLGGEVAGRWAGSLAIGAGVGLMIALAEVAARRAWISVSFGPVDSYDLALGAVPVAVGSDRASCRAFVPAIEPIAARYGFENGAAFLAHPDGRRELLSQGDSRTYGKASVTLHLERGAPLGAPVQNAPFPFAPPPTAPQVTLPHTALPPQYVSPVPPTPVPALTPSITPAVPPAPLPPLKWKWDGGEAALPIERERCSLGRADGNDIVLPAPSVSGRHALLERRAGRWTITDLGSTNGTFVGETRLQPNVPTPIAAGQMVRLGAMNCRLERS